MKANKAGKFIKSGSGNSEYFCFVPNELPLKINYDDEMIYLVSEANRFIGRLDEVTDTLVAPTYFVYMYAKKEAALSSQIEGTKATFSDLIKAEAGITDEIPNDVQEIENYIKAIEYGFDRIKNFPLSLRLIREIHNVLMQDVRGKHKSPGEFRTTQNWIGGYSINTSSFVPPSVDNLGKCLDNLEKFMHQENKISQLVKVALLHAWFEMIHPFLDGNGRLGRLLIALYLSTKNILHKPTLYLSKFFKKNQLSYYETLSNISAKGDAEAFIKFFLTGIIETASEAIDISRNIAVLREEDLVKLSCINRYGEKLLEIYNNLFAKPTVSIDTIVKKLEVSNATAGRILEKLCGTGILELLDSRKRNKIFIYKKYIDLFGDD